MNEIREFLQSHSEFSFDEGFSLLERYCANPGVVSFIARKRDKRQLAYELGKLARFPRLVPLAGHNKVESVPPCAEPQQPLEQKQSVSEQKKPVLEQKRPNLKVKTQEEKNENIVRLEDLRRHEFLKYDDMPTPYLKDIYKQKDEFRQELRHSHEKMKLAETDEDRAEWRKKVLESDAKVRECWQIIDEEMARLRAEEDEDTKKNDDFKETTCRAYISKKLSKKTPLKPQEIIEIRKNYEKLVMHGCAIKEETLTKLRALGIIS